MRSVPGDLDHLFKFLLKRLSVVVVEDSAIGAAGLGFKSRAGAIGHSVANGSPQLNLVFGTVWTRRYAAKMGPATRYTIQRNSASIIKI